jgi:hypothetical protein
MDTNSTMDANIMLQQLPGMLNMAGVTQNADGGFNWANLIGSILFGIIGWSAFMYGKKEKAGKPLGIGIALMVYPYFVSNTVLMYTIGVALTAALYFWRD